MLSDFICKSQYWITAPTHTRLFVRVCRSVRAVAEARFLSFFFFSIERATGAHDHGTCTDGTQFWFWPRLRVSPLLHLPVFCQLAPELRSRRFNVWHRYVWIHTWIHHSRASSRTRATGGGERGVLNLRRGPPCRGDLRAEGRVGSNILDVYLFIFLQEYLQYSSADPRGGR